MEADPGPGGPGVRLGKPELFLGTPFVESNPSFSPDGRVMAAAYIAKGDSFAAGKPRVWTEIRVGVTRGVRNYDITPDGKRLAAIVADDATGDKLPTHLTLLLNFFDELGRKAPVGR